MEYAYLIWIAVLAGAFAFLWRQGHLARFANYVGETREELRKCTWPSLDELKGSTAVVLISVALIAGFTVFVDAIVAVIVRWITS